MPLFISLLLAMTSFLFPITALAKVQTLTIHAVGDVLLHTKLQRKGVAQGFSSLWQAVVPLMRRADIAYANLEGPVATNSRAGSYPMFNYPQGLLKALKVSGFDIVSTANNHSLDRFARGIDSTLDNLQRHQLLAVGTHKRADDRTFFTITEQKGFKLAWISCTQDTNGIADKHQQVLYCYKKRDRSKIRQLITTLKSKVDAVIILPHWGVQYRHQPNRAQRHFGKEMLELGALVVIGSHPHVVQPILRHTTKDKRRGLIAYSLGNFVSNQGSLKNRTSGVLSVQLLKQEGKTRVGEVFWYPTVMENRGGKLSLRWVKSEKSPSFRLLKRVLGRQYLRLQ